MIHGQKQVCDLSLQELLEEVKQRTMAAPLPAEQYQPLMQMVADILQACTSPLHFPCQEMQGIRGQEHVKRALEVAAAGGHPILLAGPSGAGKKRLAQTLPTILPQAAVPYPLRSPHFSIERSAFVGEMPYAGELTLAHGGVLFLEELPSFDLSLLAAVQQAGETGVVEVSEGATYPAHFHLVATMKPCPCGFYGDPIRECICSAEALLQYQRRVAEIVHTSFDLSIEVPIIREDIGKMRPGESSTAIRKRVEAAREQQRKRYAHIPNLWVNADLQSLDEVQQYCQLDSPAEKLLNAARQQLHFTPRQSLQTQRIARTIADLAEAEIIAANHLAEAIQYRPRFGR
jgi:magnesium chelatase family protein